MRTLLDRDIDTAKIEKQRLLEANKYATFVVDIRSLEHHDDIKKDTCMYGKWVHHGSHTDVFKCRFGKQVGSCHCKVLSMTTVILNLRRGWTC